MAVADPNYDHVNSSSEEEDGADVTDNPLKPVSSPSHSKQNGTAVTHIDRYGFMGGSQYTNPEE
jgi:hypothetical protein